MSCLDMSGHAWTCLDMSGHDTCPGTRWTQLTGALHAKICSGDLSGSGSPKSYYPRMDGVGPSPSFDFSTFLPSYGIGERVRS